MAWWNALWGGDIDGIDARIDDQVARVREGSKSGQAKVFIDREHGIASGICQGCGAQLSCTFGGNRCKCDPELGRKPKWWEC
jgi:hypothetical protein